MFLFAVTIYTNFDAFTLGSLVDEPLVNAHFETLDELEEVLAQRCCYLQDNMMEEIKNLTNYHWLTFS